MLLGSLGLAQQDLRFRAADGVEVFATFYPGKKAKPIILLFHQANSNRGEYKEIAPQLVKMGFSALAIDQRSGGSMWNRTNQTRDQIRLFEDYHYSEALPDLEAALDWAKNRFKKILVWGSSYSASLVFVLAARHPEVSAVLAFSPGENLGGDRVVRDAARRVQVPVFLACAQVEARQAGAIFAAVVSSDKTEFIPKAAGLHGSIALLSSYKHEYWVAVRQFLRRFV